MKIVTLIVLNNFKNYSRVLKEKISLQNVGYDIKVVSLHAELLKELGNIQIYIHRVNRKKLLVLKKNKFTRR